MSIHSPEGLKTLAIRGDLKKLPHRGLENPVKAQALKVLPFLYVDNPGKRVPEGIQFSPWTGSVVFPSEHGRKRRFSEYQTVETAMRGAIHASHDYDPDGPVVLNAELFMGHLDRLTQLFKEGGVTKSNLDALLMDAVDVFDHQGYGERATKPAKQEATRLAIGALRQDSMGRVNPLVSRTRLARAWGYGLEEFMGAANVTTKYNKYFDALASERFIQRLGVTEVVEGAKKILYFDRDPKTFRAAVLNFEELVANTLTADNIKTAPYRVPALLFAFDVLGPERARVIMGDNSPVKPDRFLQKMFGDANEEYERFMDRIYANRDLGSIFEYPIMTTQEQMVAVNERIQNFLPLLTWALSDGEDWRMARHSCTIILDHNPKLQS